MSFTTTQGNGLLIVWHSRTGASEQLAQSAYQGATESEPQLSVSITPCAQVQRDALLAHAGYIFVCPENLASMSGAMKEFFDSHYYATLDQVNGRAYAAIVSAGSDGSGAARQIATIATGWRLKPVQDPLIVNVAAQTPEQIQAHKTVPSEALAKAHAIGAALASGLVMGIF